MVEFPLPWLVSILAVIAGVALVGNSRIPPYVRGFFCLFLASLATIGVLVGLRLSYAMAWLTHVQPLVALVIGPSAYMGFLALTQESAQSLPKPLARNAAAMVLAQFAIAALVPASADVIILGFNIIYMVRIAGFLSRDPDEFVHVADGAMPVMRSALLATVALLGLMAASDALIVAAVLFAGDGRILQFLSGAAGVFTAFVVLVALVLAPQVLRAPTTGIAPSPRQPEPSENDRRLLAALDAMMDETRLFSDNNLTLVRVARRLGVPSRLVSNAVNRCTGDNFSRYMNGFRIRHTQKLLRSTDLPVTEIMLEAGFVSKSSFNSEFRRIVGLTPSQYRTRERHI
ncbi:AraC family transcriptional regulator [uncultured Hoeflea sp.]|uniref:helix-turn-helix domain-containing protein n=1 Tax=uncultured Hoeflea sp. TaxID=538666 RepID=UPI0026396202|nr:AraC family transcriptional regulator [uncultured Hoeflea sp.]